MALYTIGIIYNHTVADSLGEKFELFPVYATNRKALLNFAVNELSVVAKSWTYHKGFSGGVYSAICKPLATEYPVLLKIFKMQEIE